MKKRISIVECDNPTCPNWAPSDSYDLAKGLHIGRTFIVHEGGGIVIPGVYACSDECVIPAFNAVADSIVNPQ